MEQHTVAVDEHPYECPSCGANSECIEPIQWSGPNEAYERYECPECACAFDACFTLETKITD